MTPSIGRIVRYYQGDFEAMGKQHPAESWEEYYQRGRTHGVHARGTNGSRYHPAIITQVHSETCVNLTVFFADGTTEARSSAVFLDDAVFAEGMRCVNSGWRWPEIVP
jgi:hypothetical protein